MKHIRDNVLENRLVTAKIEIPDYEQALFADGKGWVSLYGGEVVGFSCVRITQGDVWALFIDGIHEGKGVGNQLMEILENWMFREGCEKIKLTTEPGTRAEALYRRRGWQAHGLNSNGEMQFTLASLSRCDYLRR